MHCVEYNETSRPDKNDIKEREREGERNGSPKSHVLTSGLLWLTLNLALITQCLSWNNIFIFLIYVPPKMSSPTPGGTRNPGWIPLV
jgi:hypothetical protein